jgi:uncharacterized protein
VTIAGQGRLMVAGPAGSLETIAEEAQGLPQPYYGLVCHPHPLYGGTMDNKVVYTVARALQSAGIATLRFNFRGVGASAGAYDEGNGETQDAAAVADLGATRWPGRRLILAGFSFGAFIALRLAAARDAARLDTARLITVAPPVGRFDFSALTPPGCPWLVVQGDADELVDAAEVGAWVEGLHPRPRLVVMPGVGHFFHGHLTQLRDAVSEALRSG